MSGESTSSASSSRSSFIKALHFHFTASSSSSL
eukprot:CAMPEP_0197556984 /NCGR_PEP_ID=MMETSP1320-20131121/16180_1 /TAXON_ID=91990 /ORGANISM="Bolidomonas sp., Strain RCC2347" /LENGTH=32 /DNA_ID= /DNA_START= /DNA_END= /DNA_ORIENTATION=